MTIQHVCCLLICTVLCSAGRAEDAIDRLVLRRLQKQHAAIEALADQRTEASIKREYEDFRANLHVHSAFSHDSRGRIEDILAAAQAAGSQIIMFTEHPAANYDFFVDGHQGLRDGVLLIPGAEMQGFLVFPTQSLHGFEAAEKQELSNIVRGRGGLTFVSHLEERMDWEVHGVTGCEIYNTHADFKNEKRLIDSLKNPLWLIQAKKLFDTYPQEALSALMDYPSDYLRRFDQLCQVHPHTGVSANDAHQNVGLVIRLSDRQKVVVEDPLGEKILELDQAIFAAVQSIPEGTAVGTELYRIQLDPYACSLRHVGTHLLMKELTVAAVWDALNAGRAFVAFDWLADASGFDFALVNKDSRHEMGSRLSFQPNMMIQATAPHVVHWKLIRDGNIVHEQSGKELAYGISQAGIYRVEAWLNVADEEHVWILSNPIYVRP